jgi:hypothetical protein
MVTLSRGGRRRRKKIMDPGNFLNDCRTVGAA